MCVCVCKHIHIRREIEWKLHYMHTCTDGMPVYSYWHYTNSLCFVRFSPLYRNTPAHRKKWGKNIHFGSQIFIFHVQRCTISCFLYWARLYIYIKLTLFLWILAILKALLSGRASSCKSWRSKQCIMNCSKGKHLH